VEHTQLQPVLPLGADTVERFSTFVAYQGAGKWIYPLIFTSRTGLSRPVARFPDQWALIPQIMDLLGDLVGTIDDLLICLAPVVDHFALVEAIVENRAYGAFGGGLSGGGAVALDIQFLSQSTEGVYSAAVTT
jgi:hypothetical protein